MPRTSRPRNSGRTHIRSRRNRGTRACDPLTRRTGAQDAEQFRTASLQLRLSIPQPGESLVHLPQLARGGLPQRQRAPRAPGLRLLGPGK
ncbi:hypothetical protein GCM10022224_009650 [Nonomuraea antimicrobica]|uniref:Uncharacterized protein n=1 Tax=Nonomuraea antimicrobica TaxID=561173 RepID=A0ABP7B520_9ACTN